MDSFEVVFHISGNDYRQVYHYRQEMDLRVIQDQVARNGYAILISLHGQHGFDRISKLPALDEAMPIYSPKKNSLNSLIRPHSR
jgi:hypothetical protein